MKPGHQTVTETNNKDRTRHRVRLSQAYVPDNPKARTRLDSTGTDSLRQGDSNLPEEPRWTPVEIGDFLDECANSR